MVAKPLSAMPGVMRKRGQQITRNAGRTVRRVATTVDTRLVEDTPVDTGEARSNWLGSLDIPLSGTIPPYAPGRNLGLSETANAGAAKAQARAAIRGFRLGKNSAIVLVNNVGHIGFLNDGSSQQMGAQFVQRAVQAGRKTARGQRLLKG